MEDQFVSGMYESISDQAQVNRPTVHVNRHDMVSSMDYNEMYTMNNMATQEQQNEYQPLQRHHPSGQQENSADKDDKEQSEMKKVEYHDIRAAMKKMKMILIFTVSVNMVLLLVVSAVAFGLSAVSYRQSTSTEKTGEADRDMLSLQEELARLQLQLHCGPGQWYRIAYLNMSDPTQQCPSAWREYEMGRIRACGRAASSDQSCSSTFYSTTKKYTRMCGRVIGYQFGSPDAFKGGNQSYSDGVEITLGGSDYHTWSYIAGVTESSPQHATSNCPCSSSSDETIKPPIRIGDNYYCESGNPTFDFTNQLYSDDKLWDGELCEDSCCTGTMSPPWFSVQFPVQTNEAVEVSICGNEGTENEDTPIVLLEILVQ